VLGLLDIDKENLLSFFRDYPIWGDLESFTDHAWLVGNDSRELAQAQESYRQYAQLGRELSTSFTKVFIALVSARDGHDFISQAYSAGVKIFIVHRSYMQKAPLWNDVLWIAVEDGMEFLGRWANFLRSLIWARVVGVTGTNGKTSFKEILSGLLGNSVFHSKKNFNNEIGLPFTLLDFPYRSQPQYLVLEMGMNHSGEISRLSMQARPDVAVITSVGPGHLEFLETVENVARVKAEIIHGMAQGSMLFLPEDALYKNLIEKLCANRGISVFSYAPVEAQINLNGSMFTWRGKNFFLPLLGRHQVQNGCGALAVASYLGQNDLDQLALRMAKLALPGGRLHLVERDGVTWFLDMYNANPASMRAGISAVQEIRAAMAAKRRVLWILGEMKELGQSAAAMHYDVTQFLASVAAENDLVFLYGQRNDDYQKGWVDVKGTQENVYMYEPNDKPKIKKDLDKCIDTGDIVFIKGSRSNRLEEIME